MTTPTPSYLRLDDGREHTLALGVNTIGRGDECDVTLRHEKLSKRHARIEYRASRWYVTDLGSTNGTHTQRDGRLAPKWEVELSNGDRLGFGTLKATFHAGIPVSAAPTNSPPAKAPTSTPTPPTPASPTPIPPRPSSASTPTRPTAAPTVVQARGSRGGGLLVVTIVIFGAMFGGLYFVYQWAMAPPTEVARDSETRDALGTDPSRVDPTATDRDPADPSTAHAPPASVDRGEVAPNPTNPRRDRTTSAERRPRRPRSGINDEPFEGATPDPAEERSEESTPPTDRSEPGVVPPAAPTVPTDGNGNATELLTLLRQRPDHPEADAIRARLASSPIVVVEWRGGLPPVGRNVLRRKLPLNCRPEDRDALRAVIPDAVFVECAIEIDYEQNYRVGLGRKIGQRRMGPHPKSLEFTVTRAKANGKRERVGKIDVATPRVAKSDIPLAGLTEEEVWQRTIDRKLDRWTRVLGQLTR